MAAPEKSPEARKLHREIQNQGGGGGGMASLACERGLGIVACMSQEYGGTWELNASSSIERALRFLD